MDVDVASVSTSSQGTVSSQPLPGKGLVHLMLG